MNGNRAQKFLILLVVISLLVSIAAVLLWAATDSSRLNGGSETTTSAVSSSTTSEETDLAGCPAPDGWQRIEHEASGICYALPAQGNYTAQDVSVDVAIANRSKPMQWYITELNTNEGKRSDRFGLEDSTALVNLYLVNSPDRISLSSFACGGLCANQSIISINKDVGNTSTLTELVAKFNADRAAVFAETASEVSYIILSENTLTKWGYSVAYFQIRMVSMLDEQEYGYFLFSTGSTAYSVMHEGTNITEITQILSTLEFPID